MRQSSVVWLTRTGTRQPTPPEALQAWPPTGRKSSLPSSQVKSDLPSSYTVQPNHWHLRRWARSVFPTLFFDRTWSSAISVNSLSFAAFIVHRCCSKIQLCSIQETFLNQSQSRVNSVVTTQLGQLIIK